jgi:hypothetical protein
MFWLQQVREGMELILGASSSLAGDPSKEKKRKMLGALEFSIREFITTCFLHAMPSFTPVAVDDQKPPSRERPSKTTLIRSSLSRG